MRWLTSKWLTHGLTDIRLNDQLMHCVGGCLSLLVCVHILPPLYNNCFFINNAQCFHVSVTLISPHQLKIIELHRRHKPIHKIHLCRCTYERQYTQTSLNPHSNRQLITIYTLSLCHTHTHTHIYRNQPTLITWLPFSLTMWREMDTKW